MRSDWLWLKMEIDIDLIWSVWIIPRQFPVEKVVVIGDYAFYLPLVMQRNRKFLSIIRVIWDFRKIRFTDIIHNGNFILLVIMIVTDKVAIRAPPQYSNNSFSAEECFVFPCSALFWLRTLIFSSFS